MPSVSVNKPINGPGWYLISSSTPLQDGVELKSFYEVIHNLKADSAAEINIFKAAFYYPYAFSPDVSFTSADWNRVEDINEYYIPDGTQSGSRSYLYRMSPNLGYWVKIESYSPKIILVGDGQTSQLTNVIAELYTVFTPPTATSSGGESVTVDVSNIPVDSNNNTVTSLGTYKIIYSVVNNVGDISTRELSVTVTDPYPPVITILKPTIYLNTTNGDYTDKFNVKDLLINNDYISVSDSNTQNIIVVTTPQTLTNPSGSVQVDISANDGFSTVDASIELVFMGDPEINLLDSTDPDNGYLVINDSKQIVKLKESSNITASNLVNDGDGVTGVTVTSDPQNITDSTPFVTYNATHTASGFTNSVSYSVIRVDGPTLDASFISNGFVYGPSSDVIYVKNNVTTSVSSDIFMTTNGTLSSTPVIIEASSNTYDISFVATDNYGFKSEKTIRVETVDAPNIGIKVLGNYANFVYGPSNDTIYIQEDKGVSASGELFVDVSDNVTLTFYPITLTASNEIYPVNYVATDQYGFTSDASLSIVTVTSPNIGIKVLGNYANFVYGPSNDTIYIQEDKGVSASGELFVDVSDNVTLTFYPITLTASNEIYPVNYVATDQYGFTSDASLSIVTVTVPVLTPSSELIYPDNSLNIDYTKPYWLKESGEVTLMAPNIEGSNINAITYVNPLSDYTIDVSSTVVTGTFFADLSSVSDPSYSVITYTLTQNTYGFETDISYNVTIRTDIVPQIITGPNSFTLLDPNP